MNSNYNILTLDGGGIRGIILLYQLIELEKQLDDKICNYFNLISGTSTGAIIAVLLAKGYSALDVLNFYLANSSKIFKKSFLRFGIFTYKYSDKNFNEILNLYLGDDTLADLNCDIIIPTYNVSKKSKQLFKSTNHKKHKLFDIIRATTSAQSFFAPHKIGEDYFIDGGMVVNNPSLVAYSEAVNIGKRKINLISFSTGQIEKSFNKILLKTGILFWAKPTFDILISEQSKMADFHMQTIAMQNSETNYLRCESIINKSSGRLDDVRPKNILNMLKDGQTSANLNKNKILNFVKLIK
jgi:uncharacterized protein